MHYSRYDYLRLLLQNCSATEPTFDIQLADASRVPVRADALIETVMHASDSDAFLGELVPEGAVVDPGSLGRGLFLLAHRLLERHLYQGFSDRRLAFDTVLLMSLDRLEVPDGERRKLARRRVFAVGDLLALQNDERYELLDVDSYFSVLDQLARMGAKDVPISGWPGRDRVVRLNLSAEGENALGSIPLDRLPLAPRVACALELSLVERLSDLTAEQWSAIREVYDIDPSLFDEAEQTFASFGLDLTDLSILRTGDCLFG